MGGGWQSAGGPSAAASTFQPSWRCCPPSPTPTGLRAHLFARHGNIPRAVCVAVEAQVLTCRVAYAVKLVRLLLTGWGLPSAPDGRQAGSPGGRRTSVVSACSMPRRRPTKSINTSSGVRNAIAKAQCATWRLIEANQYESDVPSWQSAALHNMRLTCSNCLSERPNVVSGA